MTTGRQPIKLSGYLQERYTHFGQDGSNDTIETKRARIILSGDATEKLDFCLQADLSGSRNAITAVDFDTSEATTAKVGRPVLLTATIGYKINNLSKFTIGQFVVPFSMENVTPPWNFDFINRAQVVDQLVPGRDAGAFGYDTGIQFSSMIPNPAGKSQLQYTIALLNGTGLGAGDDNDRKDLSTRIVFSPIANISLGSSYYDGATGPSRVDFVRTGYEAQLKIDPWTLKGEYIKGKDGTVHKDGWYITLIHQINNRLQLAGRYDRFDPNTDTDDNATNTLTAGINWFLDEKGYSRWQANYERKKEQGTEVKNDQFMIQFQAGF